MRLMKRFFLFILVMLMLIPSVVMAREEVDAIKFIEVKSSTVSMICDNANKSLGVNILNYTMDDGLVSFSNKTYKKLSSKEKEKFMKSALLYTKESGLQASVKNKLYNFIAEQDGTTSAAIKYLSTDTGADFATASAWLKPFTGPIGTILGVLCLIIFIFLSVSIVVDVAYLALPGFQMICERGDSNKKPFIISREAFTALRDSERSAEYQSSMVLFFKRRVGTIVLIAVTLLYLISGQIYDLMSWFIDTFGSMFDF